MSRTIFSNPIVHLALIFLLGLLAYSNTFDAPFLLDDDDNIVENPIIKDVGYFLSSSKAVDFPKYTSFKSRFVGYLTFAVNYRLHGLDLTGYHITNLAIHVVNAFFVYLIILLTFRTPRMEVSALAPRARHIALLSALLFVSHPIQTQAVTYIVQRLASLATLFYMLSLVLYVKARLSNGNRVSLLFYGFSIISAVLAMKTKETAFTLPIAIALYELMFFRGRTSRRILYLTPLFLTMLIIPLTYMSLADMDRPLSEVMKEATRLEQTPRLDYLFTEFRVIATYLRLLVLPIDQNLDYDWPISHSFFEPPVFLSFLFLFSLLCLGGYFFYRSHISDSSLRILSFGIFWFFITLSVTSSVIPLMHAIVEHRVYLPSVGFFIAIATAAFLLLETLKNQKAKKAAAGAFVLMLIVIISTTYARNNVWTDELSLWKDTASKSPYKARPHNNLGLAYINNGMTDKAIDQYNIALTLDPKYPEAHYNLGHAFDTKGMTDKAIYQYNIALTFNPDLARAHYNLGNAYLSKNMFDRAIRHYQSAIRLKPDHVRAHNNLGGLYLEKGHLDNAVNHLLTAVGLQPDYVQAHNNLGIAYRQMGMLNEAEKEFSISKRLQNSR